jgi:hypothetical protein
MVRHLGRAGDTEKVDPQRAEAHLRLLAEEELRRPAWAWGERRIRAGRVAQLLTVIGALDDEVADRILADFHLALVVRQADVRGRRTLAGAVSRCAVRACNAGELTVAGVQSGTGPAGPAGAGDPVARSARRR